MTAADQRQWLETPAGRVAAATGRIERTSYEVAENSFEQHRLEFRRDRGRDLYPEEADTLRRQCEMRSAVASVASPLPASSHELAARLGWDVRVENHHRRPHVDGMPRGMATRDHTGVHGDPAVIAAVARGEAAMAEASADYTGRVGPLVRTVAGPSD